MLLQRSFSFEPWLIYQSINIIDIIKAKNYEINRSSLKLTRCRRLPIAHKKRRRQQHWRWHFAPILKRYKEISLENGGFLDQKYSLKMQSEPESMEYFR